MDPLRVRLGQAVRELRRSAGFSQEGFAAHVHVHRTSMGSIERGKINVGIDTLEQLAAGLEMPAWELLRIAEIGAGARPVYRTGAGRRRAGPQRVDESRDAGESSTRKVAEDRRR